MVWGSDPPNGSAEGKRGETKMSEIASSRIMARQLVKSRELTMDELKLVAGGGFSTDVGGGDCGSGWYPTFESMCAGSDADPCDQDVESFD